MRAVSCGVIVVQLLLISVAHSFLLNTVKCSAICRLSAHSPISKMAIQMTSTDGNEIKEPSSLTDGIEKRSLIPEGPKIFGLSPTNPQDWTTVILTGIIVYETLDLAIFWFQKLTGFAGFDSA